MKSKASYTNRWMHHYPNFWHEEKLRKGFKIIVIDKKDAPQIVKERVQEINNKRYEKNAQFYFVRRYSLDVFIASCKRRETLKDCSIKRFIEILDQQKRLEWQLNNTHIQAHDYD